MELKLKLKRKIALVTAASCLLAMSCGTAFAQGNSAFGRGQRVNHFKGRGNSAFGRANAMTHSAGHGNSAFGLRQFNGPMKGSSNSAFARGGQTFTRSGMGTWSGQRWGGRNWNGSNWSGQRWGGRNWSGSNWGGDWHHHNDVIFIGDFGFPWWWGWGYPYYGYGYGYPYGYGYDNGYGYPYGGYYGSTDYGNGYPTHSRVAELQRRLARAGYYSSAIDGIMGPATRQAIRAFERDHGYSG